MNKITQYTILLIIVFFSACAQIGTLSGGEKDTDPPKFIKSNPPEQGLNFKGDKITITFDEFFVTENINSVFLSSPPLLNKPDFKIKRKSLVIKLHEELKDTTTYTFLFGDAIKDYHAGNKMNDFRFVFSTGEKLDTMEVSGRIIDAKTHKGNAGFLVMLYNNYNDLTPIKEKPYYIAKTDTSGKFKINFIKAGKYRIFGLKDNDANLNFNLPSESIAFIDSFITPKVKKEIITDSLKAGAVLHIGSEDVKGDTLKNDTVIISEKYFYSPKNILLFSFKEDHKMQYLVNIERNIKENCRFQYSKKNDDIKTEGIGFNLTAENSFIEKQDSGRAIVIWIKNKTLFNRDSLQFTCSYFNKDSIGNLIPETDTATFFRNYENDTIKKYVKFKDNNEDLDYFKDLIIETETPFLKIDTNRIKLFELIDTLVSDPKEQKLLKYLRPTPDTVIFSLKRPFVKTFSVEPLNFDTLTNWISINYSKNNTLITCKISEKEISEKDTLNIILHYDNIYFKGQIQHFSDTLNLPLLKQQLISAERPSPDTLIFTFKKKIPPETTVDLSNGSPSNWFTKIKTDNKKQLKLKIKNKNLIEEDTIMLKIRTLDYDNTQGDKIYFEYVKNIIFKHKRQKIIKYNRPERKKLTFIFNKSLYSDIKIKTTDSLLNNNSFQIKYNNTKDTVNCEILNPEIIKKDTISIIAEYNERIKHKTIKHSDTLTLVYKKKRRKHHRHYEDKSDKNKKENTQKSANNEKKEIVSIEIPVKYYLYKDSVNERIFHINRLWKEGVSYILKLDSFAAEDYCGNFSKNKTIKFTVRKKEDYGKIILNISNIKIISNKNFYNLNDTVSVDSVKNSVLKQGQLILKLYDKENNLLKTEKLKKDTILTYENIVSGTYHIEMIYDRNENNIWDTGNYLKDIQPERIIYYPNDIIVKPNWDNSIDIIIKSQKYN